MQITFDPRDETACAGVIAAILAINGAAALEMFDTTVQNMTPRADDTVTAAEAFGIPEASPGPAVAPVGDTADEGDDSGDAITPPPPPAPSPEVDANGLPWDERIHSGPADKRPQNADGTWRKRRGVDDATVSQVEAELRGESAAPPPVAAPPAPPVAAQPDPTPAPSAPAPTPAAVDTGSGQVDAAPAINDFASLMRVVTARQTAGTLTAVQTGEICAALGLGGLRDLLQQPALVPAFAELLPPEPAA